MKELQGLPRILDTLAYAYEFIMMPTPSEQALGLEELRKSILRLYPELKVPAHAFLLCMHTQISGCLSMLCIYNQHAPRHVEQGIWEVLCLRIFTLLLHSAGDAEEHFAPLPRAHRSCHRLESLVAAIAQSSEKSCLMAGNITSGTMSSYCRGNLILPVTGTGNFVVLASSALLCASNYQARDTPEDFLWYSQHQSLVSVMYVWKRFITV